ncbi:MIP18 family protein [Perilla frutescens var. hirtella]|uniref:MIP18 family protein n=1 Tax=Perilla frutescens var. hirtella TaxID=608512 RepID=A0AAD4NYA2_PERFH|nr:MIP18 family protein [Perilla frutescens var. hirtella]
MLTQHIRDIKDPEHPYSLEELKVITEDAIEVDDKHSYVRNDLLQGHIYSDRRTLQHGNSNWLMLAGQTHTFFATSIQVNKQLNDKERVAAALENPNLVDMVDECLAPSYE